MSPLRSLFKPRWQHKNPEVRKKAISQLTDRQQLVDILYKDPEPDLKSLALARIEDSNTLDGLIDKPGDLSKKLLNQAIQQRLNQLLPAPEAMNNINQVDILTRIAALSDDPEIIASAIDRISDQGQRLEIALTHESAKIRMLAARGIDQSTLLKQLADASRGKDKTIYRYCKSQLEQRDAEEKHREQQEKRITHLIDAARQLSLNKDAPDYRNRYLGLEQQWQAFGASASDIQQTQFQDFMAIGADHLANLAKTEAMEQRHQQEINAAEKLFSTLILELEQLDVPDAARNAESSVDLLTALLEENSRRWQNANQATSPTNDQVKRYQSLSGQWRRVISTLKQLSESRAEIDKWLAEARTVDVKNYVRLQQLERSGADILKKLPWPETETPRQPQQLQQLSKQNEQLKQTIERLRSQKKQFLAQLSLQLDELEAALEANTIKKAEIAFNRIRQSLKAIDPIQRGNSEERLTSLNARLQEIKDWKGFALEPKKLGLCQQMEALCDSSLDPEELAGQIQNLQNQWKQLGSLPDKRREQSLWDQFKVASDRAWEPCAEALAQQADVRKANYRLRMDLVSQLRDYEQSIAWPDAYADNQAPSRELDGELTSVTVGSGSTKPNEMPGATPDWPLVQQTLDAARAAFNELSPVNKADDQKSRRALHKICDRIYGHLKAEYQRNIDAKEQLIDQADSLISEADLDHAIEQAKHLQAQWKTVGLTPKSVDRKLWQSFRKACDGVFKRLEDQKNQRRAEIDGKIQQAEALLMQARNTLNAFDGERSAQLLTDIRQQTGEFNAIELPSKVQGRLRQQFLELETNAEQIIAAFRGNQEKVRWRSLTNKIQACSLRASDQEKATELWQTPDELPAGIDPQALETYWREGAAMTPEDAFRKVCISLEIAADLESPDQDKQSRMELQMQRLVTSPGSKLVQDQPTVIDITNRFIALRPTTEWAQRFCQGLEKLKPAS